MGDLARLQRSVSYVAAQEGERGRGKFRKIEDGCSALKCAVLTSSVEDWKMAFFIMRRRQPWHIRDWLVSR
jgi:hypothetical protein